MNNNLLQIKFKQRLNKASSNDYDNFESWMVVEAFNKVQNELVREEAEKGENNTQNVDDLHVVVMSWEMIGENKQAYFESEQLPKDYFAFKRISTKATTKDCIKPQTMVVYDGEEANLDVLKRDPNSCPSFLWAETFKTHINNRIRIHTDGEFTIVEPILVYYRKPRQISFEGGTDEYDEPTSDVECEFKDDIIEMLIDRAASLLAGDTENIQQFQRLNPPKQQPRTR